MPPAAASSSEMVTEIVTSCPAGSISSGSKPPRDDRPRAGAETAEHLADDILEVSAADAAARLEALGAEGERLEMGALSGAAPRAAEALAEAVKTRLALGIDLAGVKGPALLLLAEDFIGRIDLGKALGGLGIVLVGIGMQLLGKAPVGTLDRRRISILPNPQHFIGVAHRSNSGLIAGSSPGHSSPNVGARMRIRNAEQDNTRRAGAARP